MKKKLGVGMAIALVAMIGVYVLLFGKVSYEVLDVLPEEINLEDIQRDRDNPVTIGLEEKYIAVLPPYGYEIELIDVVRDGGIIVLYNLIKLEDPNGEAPIFAVKVFNPLQGPIGAACQNLDILY